MGNQLDETLYEHAEYNEHAGEPPWLDDRTAALVHAVTATMADYSEAQAVILFGSVARHDERPIADSEPSDVDLLLLVDSGSESGRLPLRREVSLHMSIGQISDCYRDAPREVQITIVQHDLAGWDPLFIENVARDGSSSYLRLLRPHSRSLVSP